MGKVKILLVFNAPECSFLRQFGLKKVKSYIRTGIGYDALKKNTDH
jgi:hypothetical protein